MKASLNLLGVIIFSLLLSCSVRNETPQNTFNVSETSEIGAFPLNDCAIVYDSIDYAVVKKVAGIFAEDVEKATGIRTEVATELRQNRVVILGTIGKNRFIDQLISENKLDVSAIDGGWEQFIIKTIQSPLPGVTSALVIAGSDRRGAAYGVFKVSEAMGVSPWEWWADVPVKKHDNLYVVANYTSDKPSVKYRGIFINDEDWGLKPWASFNYEKDLGDIGPKTYARVCELLLRLKGNMFAPAMHSCTGAFYSHEQSKVVADEYGIIITTSHCEPMLFNNAALTEWDPKRDGEWNYAKNRDVILKKMDDRVREASLYENIYTIAMRGVHDEGLRGNLSEKEKVDILTDVISDQREVLEKYMNRPATEIPQIFVPYKETMNVYELGLQIPDDVTIVWVDDNYGYLKRLSNDEEKLRKGGAGVYYHTSYLGAPHNYLWLNTTPPVLMYEELSKAYRSGADKYWFLNIGDIKPAELGMQTFFELAWDVNQFDFQKIHSHQSKFLSGIFGTHYADVFQDILNNYYRLAWSRKPEYMGWEREWDSPQNEQLKNTEFSFQNYNDAQQRLADYQRISDLAYQIMNELPGNYQPAFFELMAYPVMGSYQMNRKFLLAHLSREMYQNGNLAAANWAATQSQVAFDSINSLSDRYNNLLDGKWMGMMQVPPGFVAKYQNMPNLVYSENVGESSIDLTPQETKNKMKGCTLIDLRRYKNMIAQDGHTLRVIDGIGYDWHVIQLGDITEPTVDPTNLEGTRIEYEFNGIDADSVTVYVYSLPFFPVYKGKSTQFGISVDNQTPVIAKNEPREYSISWKTNVLRNGALAVAKFPVQQSAESHTLTLTCGDPGMIIQRIVIDWGGLEDTYVGPSASLVGANEF